MRAELAGRFLLSHPPEDAKNVEDTIRDTFDEANTTFLQGSDADHGEIVDWRLDDREVHVKLEAAGRMRAHEALLRVRKSLAQSLGKTHRLGVRDVVIDEYDITFDVGKTVKEAFTIPFASGLRFDGTECTLELENVPSEWLEKAYIDRMMNLVREKVDHQYYEGKAEQHRIRYTSPSHEPAWDRDPSLEMAERDWLRQGPTKGKWVFRAPAAAVLRAMERIAVEEVLQPLGFHEIMIPHHVPLDNWVKTGHIHGVPNEVYYVVEPATRDVAQWERFRDLVKITREVPTDVLRENVTAPTAGICYAQCENVYWSYGGKTVSTDDLPILVFDRSAVSNRYESGGRHGIERVDEFHRIEPVYIGTQEQIHGIREKLLERYAHVFNDILELEWRMASVTPFYMAHSGMGDIADAEAEGTTAASSPDVTSIEWPETGTIDFEAWLPYRGSRADSEWLEFQNLSVVGDKYTDAFNIKAQRGDLWSGCSGIGLERWTVAFLAQKGLDPANWPEGFRKVLPALPKAPRFL